MQTVLKHHFGRVNFHLAGGTDKFIVRHAIRPQLLLHVQRRFRPLIHIIEKACAVWVIRARLCAESLRCAHPARQRADGQKEHQTDHAHGERCRVDACVDLAQDKAIQPAKIKTREQARERGEKTGKGEKEKNGTSTSQYYLFSKLRAEQARMKHPNICRSKRQHGEQKQDERYPSSPHAGAFVFPACCQKLRQTAARHRHHIKYNHNGENHGEAEHRFPHRLRGKNEVKGRQIRFKKPRGKHGNNLREEHTRCQSCRKGKQTDQKRFGNQDPRNAAALHPKQKIHAQLPLSALHQKAVGVHDKQTEHHGHKHGDIGHDLCHLRHIKFLGIAQGNHCLLGVDGIEYVKQAHTKGKRQKIDGKIPDAAGDIAEGQLTEHERCHLPTKTQPP